MMSGTPLETCWAFNERWNNESYYKVASCWLFPLIHTTMHGAMSITDAQFFEFIEHRSTCFGRSFRPSSGVQDCTHSTRYMSYMLVDCLLAGTRWNFSWPLACSQYDIYLTLYVQSWTPDDGRKDRPKHVQWYSINSKIVHPVGFTI